MLRWWTGAAVHVYLARDADGRVTGVFSRRDRAEAVTPPSQPVQEWTVDAPELGCGTYARAEQLEPAKSG